MKIYPLLLISLSIFISTNCHSQKSSQYTPQETEYQELFLNFKHYLNDSIASKSGSDSSTLKRASLDYLFVNGRLDSSNRRSFKPNELSLKQYQSLYEQYHHFYQFFSEREKIRLISHLSAMPIRLSTDKCLYEKLSPYQKENTFIYFDDREPDHILGYLLFIPKIPGKIYASRIMSLTLLFDSGVWTFKSFTGEIGLEYFLSEGIRPPNPENIIY